MEEGAAFGACSRRAGRRDALVEDGFAHLKNWRALAKIRTDPKGATSLVRTLLILTDQEVGR
ncbi:hypothetical protein [Streptomyces sp. NPDC057460]|uniref:hypothetical protein n=1 Tax=Streptomyces sp. NPDC057460 TaxID=3346141 RepID=UPI0036AAE188